MSSFASIRVVEVTDFSDIPSLAALSELALNHDPLHAFLGKYSGSSVYDDTLSKLTAAVRDPDSKVFKAVKPVRNADGRLVPLLVGVSQWYIGYLIVPKVDPFASKAEQQQQVNANMPAGSFFATSEFLPQSSRDSTLSTDSATPNPWTEVMRISGNTYVSAIRGKKHIYLRRMVVHPDHQRQGIGQQLMQWGLDLADEQKIVSWLFSRPAGTRLYEKAGFQVVASTKVEAEGMVVPPVVGMMRKSQPKGGV